MPVDLNFVVGGEAGQGVQSVGFLLAKILAHRGYHIFADQDYESRIRDDHNFFRVRVRDSMVGAIAEGVDILIALNMESIQLHKPKMANQGIIIFDGEDTKGVGGNNGSLFSVPLQKLAEQEAGGKLMLNSVALGAAMAAVNYDVNMLNAVLVERFGKGKVGDKNVAAAKAGYEYVQSEYKGNSGKIKLLSEDKKMRLAGNDAICLGAIAAGCKFVGGYPMTPASSIMEYMAAKSKDLDLVAVHTEDVIECLVCGLPD